MSKAQILQSFQKRAPSPSPLCSAGRARYATSPQSDAEGRLEDNASGGQVLQAQMAEQNSATSKRRVSSCPHIISLCFATVVCRFFDSILIKKTKKKTKTYEHVGFVDVVEHYSSLYICTQVITRAY